MWKYLREERAEATHPRDEAVLPPGLDRIASLRSQCHSSRSPHSMRPSLGADRTHLVRRFIQHFANPRVPPPGPSLCQRLPQSTLGPCVPELLSLRRRLLRKR